MPPIRYQTTATGSDPYDADTDDDNVLDWYEVYASFTDPNNASEKPPLPYPLPDPDGSTGATNKPVKVYILSGQSNMLGFGTVNGTDPGSYSVGLSAKQVNTGGGTSFEFTHPISDSPAEDITAAYKWTVDLQSAFLDNNAQDANGTTVTFVPGTPANGEVTVTATISGTEPDQIFVTVDVTQVP